MTGILVSGGTYSGSGDVTCDFVALGNYGARPGGATGGGTFTAPDGTLTITSGDGVYAFFKWSSTFNHNGGTVLFNSSDTQRVTDYGNAAWTWNNVISHNTHANGLLWGSSWASDTDILGDLTVSGTKFHLYNTSDKHFKVTGNAVIESGSFIRQPTALDDFEIGSLTIAEDGVFELSTDPETLSILQRNDANGYAWYNEGTFTHNDGTVSFDSITGSAVSLFNIAGGGDFYDCIIDRVDQYAVYFKYNPEIENDLTILRGIALDSDVGPAGLTFTVSGNVFIDGGTLDTSFRNSASSFRSLTISGGSYIATDGTTTLSGTYDNFSLDNQDTFTHNDGTVKIDFETPSYNSDSKIRCGTGDLYNLEVEMNRTSDAVKLSPSAGSVNQINNDLIITKGECYLYNDNYSLVVSGAVDVAANGTFGNLGTYGRNAMGKISNTGTWKATSAETVIDMDMEGDGTTYGFQNGGTFTHNDGTVVTSGTGVKCYMNFTGSTVDPVFYNLTCKQIGDYCAIHTDFTIENMLDNQNLFHDEWWI